jgi:hypothetical protein
LACIPLHFCAFNIELADIPAPCIAVLKDKFATSSPVIGAVGLRDFAAIDQSGRREPQPKYPFALHLVHKPEVATAGRFPDAGPTSERDVLDQLLTLRAGEAIHAVHAQAAPGAPLVHIADIVLTSAPVTSNWADRQLFFRHGQMLDDLEEHPDWASAHSIYGQPAVFGVCPAVASHAAYDDVCARAAQAQGGGQRQAQLEEAAAQKAKAEEASASANGRGRGRGNGRGRGSRLSRWASRRASSRRAGGGAHAREGEGAGAGVGAADSGADETASPI